MCRKKAQIYRTRARALNIAGEHAKIHFVNAKHDEQLSSAMRVPGKRDIGQGVQTA